jgi:hypothetical protein
MYTVFWFNKQNECDLSGHYLGAVGVPAVADVPAVGGVPAVAVGPASECVSPTTVQLVSYCQGHSLLMLASLISLVNVLLLESLLLLASIFFSGVPAATNFLLTGPAILLYFKNRIYCYGSADTKCVIAAGEIMIRNGQLVIHVSELVYAV